MQLENQTQTSDATSPCIFSVECKDCELLFTSKTKSRQVLSRALTAAATSTGCTHEERAHCCRSAAAASLCLFHTVCLCAVGYGLVTAINPYAFKFLCLIVFMFVNELSVFENSLASNCPLRDEWHILNWTRWTTVRTTLSLSLLQVKCFWNSLSDGRVVSNNVCNVQKQTIQRARSLYAVVGQVCDRSSINCGNSTTYKYVCIIQIPKFCYRSHYSNQRLFTVQPNKLKTVNASSSDARHWLLSFTSDTLSSMWVHHFLSVPSVWAHYLNPVWTPPKMKTNM